MLSSLTPTDVAFVMAGLMQAVPAVLWLIGGWALGRSSGTERAAVHWSAYAAASALSFVFLVAAMQSRGDPQRAEWLRAVGNICGVIGLMALQRGIWLF
ncbi:MAG TPA: hypothetical protein VFA35_02875, partial [Burkholderiaceae bacterium]|nr:hypothetical protein [Burkholderiaceae bacterium]